MKIENLLYESKLYLYEGLTLTEQKSVKLWENAGYKLLEAQLTVDQINQLFQQIEQSTTASGSNRTILGKGMDVASAVNKAWEDLKTKVQNSGPIKNVDAMYDQAAEKLKQATGGDQGVMKYVQMYRDFAKKHPVAQGIIYSALIAAAGISGAGLGGAAALGLFKMVDKLLQGEKFSSAAYSGAKTGAMAYGASKVGDLIKGKPDAVGQGASAGSGITNDMSYDQAYNTYIQKFAQDPNNPSAMIIQQAKQFAATKAKDALSTGADVAGNVAGAGISAVRQQASEQALKAVQDAIANGTDPSMTNTLKGIAQGVIDKFGSAAGGPISQQSIETIALKAAMSAAKQAGGTNESVELNETTIGLIFSKTSFIHNKLVTEGIMDTVKGAASKAANWVGTKAKNVTTKVTADKLMSAWKKAGSPTDSSILATFLVKNGVSQDIITNVFSAMRIPMTKQSTPAAASHSQSTQTASKPPISTDVQPSGSDELARIKKNAGLATGGAGAFGQMAQQLTQPTTSSTGGTTTQTSTGLRHTANPNNPNLAMPNVRANAAQAMKRKPAGQSQPVVH